MAARKASKSRSARKKRSTSGKKNNSVQNKQFDKLILNTVVPAVSFGLCVFLEITLFGLGGIAGKKIAEVFFGLFGFFAYLMPIALFTLICFNIANKGNIVAKIKTIASVFFLWGLCVFAQLCSKGYVETQDYMAYYDASVQSKAMGGLVGGSVVKLLFPLIGGFGLFILDFSVIFVSFIIISEKSLFSDIYQLYKTKKKSRKKQEKKSSKKKPRREKEYVEEKPQKNINKENKKKSVLYSIPTMDFKEEEEKLAQELASDEVDKQAVSSSTNQKKEETDLKNSVLDDFNDYSPKPLDADLSVEDGLLDEELTVEISKDDFLEKLSKDKKEDFEEDLPISEESLDDEILIDDIIIDTDEISKEALEDGNTLSDDRVFEINVEEDDDEIIPLDTEILNPDDIKPIETETLMHNETEESSEKASVSASKYEFPPIDFLEKGNSDSAMDSRTKIAETGKRLVETLRNFGVKVTLIGASCGPTVTRYELKPEQGVKVSKILGLTDDIKLNLAATDVRIEAPIPGKAAIGIEVPNEHVVSVPLRELLESKEFEEFKPKLAFAVGKDIAGKNVICDISKMPHLLIAGATGSGKSVCINTIIMSILYKARPDEVKMILIDPKVVELSIYKGIPHLINNEVVSKPDRAIGVLKWAEKEMDDRYEHFVQYGVRNIKGYNEKAEKSQNTDQPMKKMYQLLIVIDELADLMMLASKEVENSIQRLTQLARAAGIHLVLATQRPSVNVITGVIKANMASRLAFAVSSGIDSRTILDCVGAERLLGKGDMLFYPQDYAKPQRLQGPFVSDDEIIKVVDFLKSKSVPEEEEVKANFEEYIVTNPSGSKSKSDNDVDPLFVEAGQLIIRKKKASIGMLQRTLSVGFNRAARIMDQLCFAGVVGGEEGTKPRKILMDEVGFLQYVQENNL